MKTIIMIIIMAIALSLINYAVPRSQVSSVYVIDNNTPRNWVRLDNSAIVQYDVYSPRAISDYNVEYYYIGQGCIYMINNQLARGACSAGYFFVKRLDIN